LNERFDLLAWNAAYAALWPGVVGAAPGERNVLWQVFTHADCCHPYVNRAEQVARLVAQLRGAYGRHVGEPTWTRFVRRLTAVSPESASGGAGPEVPSQPPSLKTSRPPASSQLTMTPTSPAVHAVPCTGMVVPRPADEITRQAICELLAGHGADEHFPCWE